MFEVATVKDVSTSLHSIFDKYEQDRSDMRTMSDFVKHHGDVLHFFIAGNTSSYTSNAALGLFDFDNAVKCLDSHYWSQVMNMTDVLECMPNDKRSEWNEQIRENKTVPFEKETVLSTVQYLLLSRESFVAEKVEGIFNKLSGRHKTNSPMAFRERMIIEYVMDKFHSINYDRVGYLHDLRTVIAKIQNRDEPKHWMTTEDINRIPKSNSFGEWFEFDGGAFKVRLYKAGTAHLEVHPEVANQLNRFLAMRNPTYIASKDRQESSKTKVIPLRNITVSVDVLETIRSVLGKWSLGSDRLFVSLSDNKQTKKEFIELIESIGGSVDGHYVCFDFDPTSVLSYVSRMGCVPDKKSYQFYPTTEQLSETMVRMLWPTRSWQTFLEPSAGQGGLALHLKDRDITCVEISDLNCEVLKSKGLKKVICQDFMTYPVSNKFDSIIMNPPFADGQAVAHVKKAFKHLNPGGTLVACLPSSLKNKTIINNVDHRWSVTFEDQFEGTSVRVVILKIKIPGKEEE